MYDCENDLLITVRMTVLLLWEWLLYYFENDCFIIVRMTPSLLWEWLLYYPENGCFIMWEWLLYCENDCFIIGRMTPLLFRDWPLYYYENDCFIIVRATLLLLWERLLSCGAAIVNQICSFPWIFKMWSKANRNLTNHIRWLVLLFFPSSDK
jgi:hypothetical protein